MLWLFDVGYTAIGRFSEDMLINLDATQLLCMPMFSSDASWDLSKRVGRVNTSYYIRYMTLFQKSSNVTATFYHATEMWRLGFC